MGLIRNMLKEITRAFFAHFIIAKLCLERVLNVMNHVFIYHPLKKRDSTLGGKYSTAVETDYVTFYHAVSYKQFGIRTQFLKIALKS